MKVNLRKIGAIVAGATILASSVAFAGLSFGNTVLVNDNGAPQVKVVVGEKAMASDGVAAANIAAKIANEAFKSTKLTAQVVGEATCSAGSGAGTCTVSDKKVTLEITSPGAGTGASYTLSTLIGDDIDRVLLDRGTNSLSSSGYTYGADTTDTSNPFTDGSSTKLTSAPDYTKIYKIDGSMFNALNSEPVEDGYAGKTYTETQNIWLNGYTHYGSSDDQVVAPMQLVAYTLKFKGASDDLGIQKCTTPQNTSWYAYCTSSSDSDYLTSTHKVSVTFLGQQWFISEMSPPTTSTTSESTVTPGGYVKLAKESHSGIVNVGDEGFDLGDVRIVLDDLEAHGDTTSSIISIVDKATGESIKKDKANVGITKEINAGGKNYKVHVYKIAPGYTYGAKWVDMAVYSDELKLQDGQKLDPDKDDNKYWKVSVGWKNKGASSSDWMPDSLRTIILYTSNTESLIPNSGTMRKGEFVPIVQAPAQWKLTYSGLSTVEYDALNFRLYRDADKTNLNKVYVRDTTNWEYCNLTKPYLYVTSEKSSAFTATTTDSTVNNVGSATSSKFYVALGGVVCNTTAFNLYAGSVLMPQSSTSDDYWVLLNHTSKTVGSSNVTYSLVGDQMTWGTGGLLTFMNVTEADRSWVNGTALTNVTGVNWLGTNTAKVDWIIGMSEKATDAYDNTSKIFFGVDSGSGSDATFNFDDNSNGQGSISTATAIQYFKKDYVYYVKAGPKGTGNSTMKEGLVTDRGSKFVSMDDEQVRFNMAKSIARAQFLLAASDSTDTTDSITKIMAEGDETTVGGVKIKVKSIDEKVGACAVGTGTTPACTVDSTGVSATIMPDDVAELSAVVPYQLTTSLVVLDKDAVDTDTVITVGGPVVNTVTKSVLEGSGVDFTATPKVVKEVVAGKKIVVAGLTAEDTLSAAADFIAAVKKA
jgi:hypothetical protein